LEELICGRATIDLGDSNVCLTRHGGIANVAGLNTAKVDRSVAGQWQVDGSAEGDDLVVGRNKYTTISEGWALIFIQTRRGRQGDRLQDTTRIGDGPECHQASTNIGDPENTSTGPSSVGSNCRLTDSGSTSRQRGSLTSLGEERLSRGISAELEGVGGIADGSHVEVTTLERVTTNTTEHGVARGNGLQDTVGSLRAVLEAAQVIHVHDVDLGVLSNRDSDTVDRTGLEHGLVEKSDPG
jgi:hypothetical protein